MATAAYCDTCASYVYVTEDGACPNGHTPEHLSAHYEADARPVTQPVAERVVQPLPVETRAPSRRPKWLIPAIIAVLMVFGLAFAAVAVDFMGDYRAMNAVNGCYDQQYDIDSAVDRYVAQTGALPATIGDLVPEYLSERPRCPDGGSYLSDFETGVLRCSVHGSLTPPPEDCATDT